MKKMNVFRATMLVLLSGTIMLVWSCKKDSNANLVYDASGNAYHTITIGNQVWMQENLMTTKYNTYIGITYIDASPTADQLVNGGYTNYNLSDDYAQVYGRLYNWYAVNSGILAPKGWHVATKSDWDTLALYLGGYDVAGGKLKSTGTTYWSAPNLGATNSTGFTALPGGYRYHNSGSSTGAGDVGIWWTSTQADSVSAYYFEMTSDEMLLDTNAYDKREFFSVRCVKDK